MKFVAFGALAMMVAVAALLLMSRETSAAPKAGERIPGQYIVVFVDGVNPSIAANEMAGEHGLRLLHVYSHALNGFAAQVPEGRLQALEKDPRPLEWAGPFCWPFCCWVCCNETRPQTTSPPRQRRSSMAGL